MRAKLQQKVPSLALKGTILKGTAIFYALYAFFAYLYISDTREKHIESFKTHANILADDVWNLNQGSIDIYLNLVLKTDHFQSLGIDFDSGETFVEVATISLGSLDSFFKNLHLIWIRELRTPIIYKGDNIGFLYGKKIIRVIYPLINILLIQLLAAIAVIFIYYLIYNRRILQHQVKERTRRYHELVDLLPEMVLETDTMGRILFANRLALERFVIEKNDGDLSQYSCNDFFDIQSPEKRFWIFGGHNNHKQHEYWATPPDAGKFPVLIRSAPIVSEGKIVGARIVIVDVTEQHALNEQLNRDQKMKSIGMMAGGVAHDLNNILSGVVNYPELMLMKLPEDSDLIKYITPMQQAGMRAAAIVADLLTVARGIAAPRQTKDAKELVIDYLESPEFYRLLATYPNLNYRTSFDTLPTFISCSDIHVRKCLMNLVTNAAEAMGGEGHVNIKTLRVQVSATQSRKLNIEKGPYVTISIEDQGPGIDAEALDHIFEPFYTKKEMGRSGTGLGLTIVWNTMEDHEGTVEIYTATEGTVFTLYFPFAENEPQPAHEKEQIIKHGNGESILVIDDEPDQRDIASQLLSSLGYSVETVSSGEEAIEFIKENNPDILLLDMVIGRGLNGLETYEKILQIKPDQKAVIASGFSESDDVKATLKLGAGGLINKPYTKIQLAEVIAKALSH